MYPANAHLGRFESTPPGQWVRDPKHPVLDIRYIPEPPVSVRGALNPWDQERQRQVFMAEEAAWRKVQAYQARYRGLIRQSESLLRIYNTMVTQLEEMTGEKQEGMFSAQNIMEFIASSGGNPYIAAGLFLKKIVTMAFDMMKAARIKRHIAKLVVVQERIVAVYKQMTALQKKIEYEIMAGERIRQQQQATVRKDLEQSFLTVVKRQGLDAIRAAALKERNEQMALLYPNRKENRYEPL